MPEDICNDDPIVYISTAASPGVLVSWDKLATTSIAFIQVAKSTTGLDGQYNVAVTLPGYSRMWVDNYGDPNAFYQVREINVDNSVAVAHNPVGGMELLIKASLIYQVASFLKIPVRDEPAIFNRGRTSCRWTFQNWNVSARKPEIRISSAQNDGDTGSYATLDEIVPITSTQNDINGDPVNNYPDGLRYQLDYQGNCSFLTEAGAPVAVSEFDVVLGTYYVSLFTSSEMNQALYQALQTINTYPGTRKYYNLASCPFWYDAALICGATYFLLRQLLVQLTTREKRYLLQDPDSGAFDSMASLRESAKMYGEDWKEFLKTVPKAKYPASRMIVQPEYQMPGGRSRMFRSIWKQMS